MNDSLATGSARLPLGTTMSHSTDDYVQAVEHQVFVTTGIHITEPTIQQLEALARTTDRNLVDWFPSRDALIGVVDDGSRVSV